MTARNSLAFHHSDASAASYLPQNELLDQWIPVEKHFAQQISVQSELRQGLSPLSLKTFQVNLGKRCNQTCRHCHVDASPIRTEAMSLEIMDQCLQTLAICPEFEVVDITGGAPEMHPLFNYFVKGARELGKRVLDRCNLTILEEPWFENLGAFLADHQVEIVASLPCYSEANTDKQRGNGVFAKSIAALKKLNALGYGSTLPLNLVYNPIGPNLSPEQSRLEADYKTRLNNDFGIVFHHLFCINNLPINRFLEDLVRQGKLQTYMDLLVNSFNPATSEGLMCRHQISVGYDGSVFDCDFNQMLEIKAYPIGHIRDFDRTTFLSRQIRVGNHCYGCTAGAGSSCSGEIMKRKA